MSHRRATPPVFLPNFDVPTEVSSAIRNGEDILSMLRVDEIARFLEIFGKIEKNTHDFLFKVAEFARKTVGRKLRIEDVGVALLRRGGWLPSNGANVAQGHYGTLGIWKAAEGFPLGFPVRFRFPSRAEHLHREIFAIDVPGIKTDSPRLVEGDRLVVHIPGDDLSGNCLTLLLLYLRVHLDTQLRVNV